MQKAAAGSRRPGRRRPRCRCSRCRAPHPGPPARGASVAAAPIPRCRTTAAAPTRRFLMRRCCTYPAAACHCKQPRQQGLPHHSSPPGLLAETTHTGIVLNGDSREKQLARPTVPILDMQITRQEMHSIYRQTPCLLPRHRSRAADLLPAALSGCTGMLKPVVRALKGCGLASCRCGGSSMLTAADAAGAEAGVIVGPLVHLTVFNGCNQAYHSNMRS